MALKSNPVQLEDCLNFVCCGDKIVIRQNGNGTPLTQENLPDTSLCLKLVKGQAVSDWFYDEEYKFNAFLLENDTPLPSDCTLIPIREFFWTSKTEEQQTNAMPSLTGALSARAMGLLKWRNTTRFCPYCGNGLHDDPKFTARTCIKCGHQYFPRIEPAVIVLVKKDGKVLLAKHTYRNQNIYTCIAGFVEIGETLEQCVEREVKEETNLEIQNIKYMGSQGWPYPDQLMLAFTADYKSGEIKVQADELSEAAFFDPACVTETPKPGSVAYNLIHNLFKN